MRTVLILVLVGLGIGGCSSTALAPEEARSTQAEQAATGTPVVGEATSRFAPMAVTVRPPALLLGPGQGTPVIPFPVPTPTLLPGWWTYTSAALGVAVEVPSDWAVEEQAGMVTFTSPQGDAILLQGPPAAPQPGMDSWQCSALVNASGLTVDACADAASQQFRAVFGIPTGGAARAVELSTRTRAALDVYTSMINSLRPAR